MYTHMASSLSMSGLRGRTVHRLREIALSPCVLYDHHGHSWRVTIPYAVYVVCSKIIRIGTVVVVHWVGCVCNQS